MKKFLNKNIIIFLCLLLTLYLIDLVYTKIYSSSFSRNKTQYILNLKSHDTINYIFLGSSRVENTIVASQIEKLTNKSAINLGTQGARLDDMNLFLRLIIDKKINIEKLFIQVDYIYNFETNSNIVRSQALPYIHSNNVIREYLKRTDSNYVKNYYFPFYRYATNDYRIGFRELFAKAIKKESKINFNDGFVPVFGSISYTKKTNATLPKTILKSNRSFQEIDSLCKANKIEVVYFCAPFCSSIESNNYLTKLKDKLSNFSDFSSVIKDDNLFKDCSHLNKQGAYNFTKYLVEELNL